MVSKKLYTLFLQSLDGYGYDDTVAVWLGRRRAGRFCVADGSDPRDNAGRAPVKARAGIGSVWSHFFPIVSGQLIAFAVAAAVRGFTLKEALLLLVPAMMLGLPLGLLYDHVVGDRQSVFSYVPASAPELFWALNGMLSYGVAIATAALFDVQLPAHRSAHVQRVGFTLFVLAVVAMALLLMRPVHGVTAMFVWGALLIFAAEALAALCGRIGPFFALLKGNSRPSAMLWASSVMLGAFYELLNGVFPLWHWSARSEIGFWCTEGLVIVLGYVVLLQPMLVLSRLCLPRRVET